MMWILFELFELRIIPEQGEYGFTLCQFITKLETYTLLSIMFDNGDWYVDGGFFLRWSSHLGWRPPF
jgi:hypothetical protein